MTKQEKRIVELKRSLDDADEWLQKHRHMRELPNYEKNRAAAHELRKKFWQLKDPDYYARVYQ